MKSFVPVLRLKSGKRRTGRQCPAGNRILVLILCGLLAWALPIAAQQQSSAGKNPLWRVQSGKQVVYLMGSIHLLRKDSYPLSQPLEQAFQDSQRLVLEVNLDALQDPASQQMLLTKGLNTDGRTLQEILSPETYKLAAKEVETLGFNLEKLGMFKPWMVAMTLTTLQLQRMGFDPNYGIDKYFFDKAKIAKKPVLELETLEYQLSRLDGMSPKMQEAFLLQNLKDLKNAEQEFNDVISAWRNGDVTKLESTVLESFTEFPEAYEKLIVERNRNWIPQIESYLKQSEIHLVVVGAGHLLGKDGLLRLLKDKGYSVEQM